MTWQGIRRDTDFTEAAGVLNAIGVRYYSDGEIRRRLGMERTGSRLAGAVLGIAHFRETSRRVQYAVDLAVGGSLDATVVT